MFTLVVDDFGIKFTRRRDADHLAIVLEDLYVITKDWEGKILLGLTLNWYYTNRTMDVSIPKYIEAALHKFQHPTPLKPQDTPNQCHRPTYGSATQYTDPEDNSAPLPTEGITVVRKIVGKFLYYDLAVNYTMLVALRDLSATQSKATEQTYEGVVWLLNYASSHPTAVVQYKKIKKILLVHSNVLYLSVAKARSRVGGYHCLGNYSKDTP